VRILRQSMRRKKYFFDELTCHYYLFDRLEFSHIQQYNNNIKQARETRTYIVIRVLLLLSADYCIYVCVCMCL